MRWPAVILRWLVFGILIRPGRLDPDTWKAAFLGIPGVILILGLVKSVDIYGFILILGSGRMEVYQLFMIASLIFHFLMLPPWMLRRRWLRPK